MTVTLTYNDDLARVQIAVTGVPADADHVLIERSTDGITWTTVRGGAAVPIAAGTATLDDFEFSDGIPNVYRASAVDTAAITYVASGASASNANAAGTSTLNPALPAGLADGDLMVLQASIRNSGTGTVDTPAGWTAMAVTGNVALLGRRYVTGDTAPTVSFTGGAANATVMARVHGFHNAELAPATHNSQLNTSAQNVAYPALTVPDDGHLILAAGWKQDDWTSVAALAGWTEAADNTTTAGDDASQVLDYQIQTTAADVVAGAFTVTGGAAAISRTIIAAFAPAAYLTQESAQITPSLAGAGCQDTPVWLKSIARPFLNRTVTVVQRGEPAITRPARAGVFDIVGRSFPVAVSDVRTSRRWTMHLRTYTAAEADAVDLLLASGDPLFIHVPAVCADTVPGGYVSVGDAVRSWHPLRPAHQLWTLPCVEVAPPAASVVGATITWAGVINSYATWADVIADNASWSDLLADVGDADDVIVP